MNESGPEVDEPVIGQEQEGGYEPQGPASGEELRRQEENFGPPRLGRLKKIGLVLGGLITAGGIGAKIKADLGSDTEGAKVTFVPRPEQTQVIEVPAVTDKTKVPGTTVEVPTITPGKIETPAPTEKPAEKTEVTEFTRYELLGNKIDSSQLSSQEKAKFREQLENYKAIERVQKRFIEAYLGNLGPDGRTPEYLYYMRRVWPEFGDFKVENQIFVLQNQKLIEGTIRREIDGLVKDFDEGKLRTVFEQMASKIQFVPQEGGPYAGLILPLKYYSVFEAGDRPFDEKIAFENLSEAEIIKIKKILEVYGPVFGDHKAVKSSGASQYEAQVGEGIPGEIRLNPAIAGNGEHELAHAANIAQNRWLALHLGPAELIDALTAHEKALADPVYGVQFNSLDFLGKDASGVTKEISRIPVTIILANTDSPSGGELFGKGEMSDFAKGRAGKVLDESEFWKVVGIEVKDSKRVENWDQLIKLRGENLSRLGEASDYYAWVINFIKANPARADRLGKWNFGPRSTAFNSNASDRGYFNAIREDFDGIFMISLFNGDNSAMEVFGKLEPEKQRQLVSNTINLYKHATYEQWAYAAAHGLLSGDENNPFVGYYRDVVAKYR